ncbi:MAG: hypothetical protein AAGH64_03755 [Planctomycetota bacterium]
MTRSSTSRRLHSPRSSFVIGVVAGGALLGAGLFLGGAQRSRHHDRRPDAGFGTLQAEKLEIVDRRGRVQFRVRGNHHDGGLLQVFDRSGDVRVELRADGSVRTFGGNGRRRALLGRDPDGWGSRRGGVLELYDASGRLTTLLPHKDHPSDCGCDFCAAGGYGGHDHDHHRDHDHRDRDRRDDDRYRDGYGDERDPFPRRRRWGVPEDEDE